MLSRKAKLCLALLGALAALAAGALGALANETVKDKNGDLFGLFHGNISPRKLPRAGLAPITVQMGGKIKTTDHSTPPKLTEIILEINRSGKIQTKGLGSCTLGQLNALSAKSAEHKCGTALIGHGNVTTRVSLPGQSPFASNGSLLAFNGRYKGHSAVLAQVESSSSTLSLNYVIPFEVQKDHGTYGTKLVGILPEIASEYGYITAFDLSLGHTYHYRGNKMSYASASCPAPKGFTIGSFKMARSTYLFEDGRKLQGILEETCHVRGG